MTSYHDDEPRDLLWESCAEFVLTVAAGKRLIGKGVAALPVVRRAMHAGMVAVGKGTTNAYVLEELLGRPIEKGGYALGATLPPAGPPRERVFRGSVPEAVFREGQLVEGLTVQEAVQQMSAGDVLIKGANALDYENGIAGLLVGHPAGGTLGGTIGSVYGRKIHLIIPVGLEKQVCGGLEEAESVLLELGPQAQGVPSLWCFRGEIVTEIEALELLSGCGVYQIGAGGVAGAEGSSRLLAVGSEEQVQQARVVVEGVQGEAPFWSEG